ncbi:MAG: polysaccharide deacetylase [Alphaproteobacteria bacterium]|nr:polysaccharide deacetylase [Alphaproteobacteria bacterium]
MTRKHAWEGIPPHPSNPSPAAPPLAWPGGRRAALFLSVDVDAETAWTDDDPTRTDHLVSLSFGGYEGRVGTAKMLELFRQLGVKATFFIPGWVVDAYPAMAEAVLKDGHEIGHHGYHHLRPDPGSAFIEDELARGFETLKRRLGVRPLGYRAPGGEFCEALRVALARDGILYSSSFRDDVRPYRHLLASGAPGTIELPVSANFDDWMLGLSARFSPRSVMAPRDVLAMWNDELDEVVEWAAMLTTVLHPQVSGRPMRLRLLREFLTRALDKGDVWVATGAEIAGHFLATEVGKP